MTDTLDLDTLVLSPGKHETRDDGLCAMEAVAWLAGEPHTDHPQCVSRVLAAYVRVLDNIMPDDHRQRLIPYLPRMVGTAGDREADRRRAYLAADGAVRVIAPLALEGVGLRGEAETLRALPVVDSDTARAVEEASLAVLAGMGGEAGAAADKAVGAAWAVANAAARQAGKLAATMWVRRAAKYATRAVWEAARAGEAVEAVQEAAEAVQKAVEKAYWAGVAAGAVEEAVYAAGAAAEAAYAAVRAGADPALVWDSALDLLDRLIAA